MVFFHNSVPFLGDFDIFLINFAAKLAICIVNEKVVFVPTLINIDTLWLVFLL